VEPIGKKARIISRRFYPNSVGEIESHIATAAYEETWKFNDGKTPEVVSTHEYALITINEDCKIIRYDQIVDKQDQLAIFSRLNDILDSEKPDL